MREANEFAQLPAERRLRIVIDVEFPEQQHAMLLERSQARLRQIVVGQQAVAIDVQHLRSDVRT